MIIKEFGHMIKRFFSEFLKIMFPFEAFNFQSLLTTGMQMWDNQFFNDLCLIV